jgi:ribose-phosphate pyrophosphokinase
MSIIGDVKDKNILIVDDMADTAGTLCKAADLMMDNGARSVRAMVTHPVMSGKAIENVMNSKMTELIFTDSIPFDQTKCAKVRVISVADMFAETIMQVYNHESISAKYLL